ncbi:MAG: NAD(P)-dependent oxidoreductase [Nitrososphaera sp.]|jgi:3-hydroxyisobutyrate dehydrogenase
MKIGIIGIGLLGKSVGIRILNNGHELTVYNRTSEKTQSLVNLGAKSVSSPKEVAERSDFVITVLKDSQIIEEVAFGKNGVIHGKHPGLHIADMSTISPIHSKRIYKKYHEYGIPMIDSPVMGGPPLAEKGELVVMIGGSDDLVTKWKPIFDSIATRTYHIGNNGAGHAMKLAMNLQIALLAISLSEGIILAKKSDLDPLVFLDVLNSTYFKTGMSINKGPKMAKGIFDPTFYLKMMQKDLDEISFTAKEFGANLPMAKVANKIYKDAIKEGMSELDYTGILAYLEKISDKD